MQIKINWSENIVLHRRHSVGSWYFFISPPNQSGKKRPSSYKMRFARGTERNLLWCKRRRVTRVVIKCALMDALAALNQRLAHLSAAPKSSKSLIKNACDDIFNLSATRISARGLFRLSISFAFLSIRALCRFTGDTRRELERVSEKVFYFGVRAGHF